MILALNLPIIKTIQELCIYNDTLRNKAVTLGNFPSLCLNLETVVIFGPHEKKSTVSKGDI